MMRIFECSEIEWDTDDQILDLPRKLKVEINNDIDDIEESLSDQLTNITGFCHKGFDYKEIETN